MLCIAEMFSVSQDGGSGVQASQTQKRHLVASKPGSWLPTSKDRFFFFFLGK